MSVPTIYHLTYNCNLPPQPRPLSVYTVAPWAMDKVVGRAKNEVVDRASDEGMAMVIDTNPIINQLALLKGTRYKNRLV